MSVKLNISRLETDYCGQYDYDNEFVPELKNAGAVIDREEIDGDTYMVIDGLETQEIFDILNGMLIDGNAEDYATVDEAPANAEVIEPADNVAECSGNDCNPEFIEECGDDFISESDDEYASISVDFDALNETAKPVNTTSKRKPVATPGVDFPLYENVGVRKPVHAHRTTAIPGVDFPLYENVGKTTKNTTTSFMSNRDDIELNEAFKGISKPSNKKSGCCPPNGKLRSLNEALKARDEKQQDKVDKAVKSIEDIIKSVKSTTIGAHEASEAIKKLKKEQRVLKAIEGENGKPLGIEDVRGAKGALAAIANTSEENAKEAKKLTAIKEKVEEALRKRQTYLYENVTINGRNLKDASLEGLNKLLVETIKAKAVLTNKLANALNESADTTNLKATLAKQTKLIEILENEITYRMAAAKRFAELLEDDGFESGTSGGSFTDDDLKNMFGNIDEPTSDDNKDDNKDGDKDKENKDKNSDENKDGDTEEVELSSISITLPNKEAAEELKQLCLDAGIPEDALEIDEEGEENSEESSDENSDENSEENNSGEENNDQSQENSETPNESLNTKPNLKKLLEDENQSQDNGGEDNADQSQDNGGEENNEGEEKEVHVILTNTDYVEKLAQVLKDSYNISTEEFEEMIGGKLASSDENSEEDNSDENKDVNSDENKDENKDENNDENSDNEGDKVSSDDLNNLFQGL